MTLALDWAACVRARSRAAACRACVDACPTHAISLLGPRESVKVDLAACTACGQCQPVCPTGAFSGVVEVGAFVAAAGPALACTASFCLASLSSEDFVTLALKHGAVTVDGAGCQACKATRPVVAERIEQANAFVSAAGFEARLVVSVRPRAREAEAPPAPTAKAENSRRALLRRFVPGLVEQPAVKPPLALAPVGVGVVEPARLKARPLPERRVRLLEALAQATAVRAPDALDAAQLDFSSSKALNLTTCTGCLQCVSACPTGALTASRAQDAVHFDASRCVKCRTCHDACEPGALTVSRRFETADFVAARVVELGRFVVKDCGECGARFKYDGGDALCPRCVGHDDEARALHGLPPRDPGASA
ncbi:MAG: 4Fe-4S binding protein [Myxococcus sp.]|nr:4Fe-4S binding protein [Myxococcus sp.]